MSNHNRVQSSAEIQFNNHCAEYKELLTFTRKSIAEYEQVIADANAHVERLTKQYDALRSMQEVVVEFNSNQKS
tara:strand:+ start:1229 stop:1450 length:222 start_codon:yes stop_codon:yes gene_type:complete